MALSVRYYQLMKVAGRARRAGRLKGSRGSERFILQAVPDIEPIPRRPAGYFKFDAEDRSLGKRLAKASLIPALRSE